MITLVFGLSVELATTACVGSDPAPSSSDNGSSSGTSGSSGASSGSSGGSSGASSGSSGSGSGRKLIFVTSQPIAASMGGLDGADAHCTAVANAAGLSGHFHAWLSSGTKTALDRVVHSPNGYERTDGTTVAEKFGDLLTPALKAPIDVDEKKTPINDPVVNVWTNTGFNGAAQMSFGYDCDGFTANASPQGSTGGNAKRTGIEFTVWSPNIACGETARLYCLQD
jgi:hypothetical protein